MPAILPRIVHGLSLPVALGVRNPAHCAPRDPSACVTAELHQPQKGLGVRGEERKVGGCQGGCVGVFGFFDLLFFVGLWRERESVCVCVFGCLFICLVVAIVLLQAH